MFFPYCDFLHIVSCTIISSCLPVSLQASLSNYPFIGVGLSPGRIVPGVSAQIHSFIHSYTRNGSPTLGEHRFELCFSTISEGVPRAPGSFRAGQRGPCRYIYIYMIYTPNATPSRPSVSRIYIYIYIRQMATASTLGQGGRQVYCKGLPPYIYIGI